ncbi:Dabb family protein [Prolixibacter sp. SD074]|jgi:hypothetical protein|uniref:Dabb family protein n=1 Tax=Prolixibacter sp. SD074 TaxID=2652391 RepID=UPI00126FFB35|nr:Dabb family protein [Prolixibacter sp. SD074]GET27971.1 stress responsive protein [Prolixibacter sp. SD074]
MINHTVLFKFKDFDSPSAKKVAIEKLTAALLNLKNEISELKHIEVNPHYTLDAPSFDMCLITHFENIAGLDVYRVHPEHLKVIGLVEELTTERAAVDFNF